MRMIRNLAARCAVAAVVAVVLWPARADALEKLCDPAYENCRTPLLNLINNETVAIDVAFWFMSDTHYSDAIIARWRAGIPVRVLMDTEANAAHPENATILSQLKSAGIPMRQKSSGGILHWKMMIFAGQQTVEWSGANYSTVAFMPGSAYQDYEDEIIHFTDDVSLLHSFQTKYDDIWTSTSGYSNYANITSLTRRYGTYAKDPELNFPPTENYRTRAVNAYNAETGSIDVSMFRITDVNHTNAMIAAKNRGVPVRLIADPTEYRNPDRLWDAYNVDKMYAAGITVKVIAHKGISHEKLVLLGNQQMAIYGSSNWTSPSAASQLEHNLFTKRADLVTWLRNHWNRKWYNQGPYPETKAFTPLPPSTPTLASPANGATGVSTSVALKWWGGKWAHKYDVYIGTSSSSMTKVLSDKELGPSLTGTDYKSFSVSLAANTTYYWKVTSRTMANIARTSATGSFTTGGSSGSTGGTLPSGWSTRDIGGVGAAGSAGYSSGTYTVKGSGTDIWGSADEFRFVYRTLSGDGSIVARVGSITNTNSWSKAGVMMRETLTAGSKHASMFVSAARGLAFQRRTSTGGTSASTAGAAANAPYWVKVTRSGSTFAAYQSADGSSWTKIGSVSMNMVSTIYVGLAVTSHSDGVLATGTFTNVGVSGTTVASLPSGWSSRDVGAVAANGTAGYSNGTFTVKGSGADIWGTADEFRFVYRTLAGDGSIVARVASLVNTNAWAKAGVMMRETLTAGSKHASMIVSAAKGLAFQRRTSTGGLSASTPGAASAVPYWVKVTRSGSTFTAYESANGSTWTKVGSATMNMVSSIYVGLAVTSHADGVIATASFTNVQ